MLSQKILIHTILYINVDSNIKTKQPHTKLVKLQGILIRKFRMIGGFSGLDNILFLKPRGGYMGVHFITI